MSALKAGLVVHSTVRPIRNPQRALLVTPEVEMKLRGKDPQCELSSLGMAEVIGPFLAGHSLSVSRICAKRKERVELEQLEGLNETWGICYRRPKPGWRLFGRFLVRDVFIGLRLYDRRNIGSDYKSVADQIDEDWKRVLGTQPYIQSADISDYLSGSHYDVDQKMQI